MNSLCRIPKKKDNLAWQVIDGQAVIMILDMNAPKDTDIEILNETASRIWELIDGENSTQKIITKITGEYDISLSDAKKDITFLLGRMVEKGIIEIV